MDGKTMLTCYNGVKAIVITVNAVGNGDRLLTAYIYINETTYKITFFFKLMHLEINNYHK